MSDYLLTLTCVYLCKRLSLFYGILYLCFVAYPIVFTQHRGWGPGTSGLSFVGMGIGTMLGISAEPLWRRLINNYPKDPVTGKPPPEATARIMIIGSVLVTVGQMGFSWTCLPASIHWAAPIAFGIPFGCGNSLCFIYGVRPLSPSLYTYRASIAGQDSPFLLSFATFFFAFYRTRLGPNAKPRGRLTTSPAPTAYTRPRPSPATR